MKDGEIWAVEYWYNDHKGWVPLECVRTTKKGALISKRAFQSANSYRKKFRVVKYVRQEVKNGI